MELTTEQAEALLEFFKLLADEKRLQMVGLLARQEQRVEDLAAALGLNPSAASRHLQRLVPWTAEGRQAGLVAERIEEHVHLYSLQLGALREWTQRALPRRPGQAPEEDLPLDDYDRKVLRDYLVGGRLKSIPGQWKKREVVLRYLVERFEPGRRYSEREVNAILGQVHEDYATLRRALVDSRRLAREREVYWRTEPEVSPGEVPPR